jgi:hypothetical protein
MELVKPPHVESFPDRPYVGIRVVTPFRGMLKTRDELMVELRDWLTHSACETSGHGFLRLHVVDMSGPMDLEVSFLTPAPTRGDARVTQGVLPSGSYATLTHRDHSLRANKVLIEWATATGLEFDREEVPAGDRFACRYEAYLTDPKLEPRKTRWEVEIAIKLAG